MDIKQAVQLGDKAHSMGLSVRASKGLVQFVKVEFSESGKSIVIPVSEYMDFDQAVEWERK